MAHRLTFEIPSTVRAAIGEMTMVKPVERALGRFPSAHKFGHKLVSSYRVLSGPRLLRRAAKREPIRIVIGASGVHDSGWTATEIDYLDITKDSDWQRFFTPASITGMLAEHVWEHLTPSDALLAAQLCLKYLKPNGYLRAAVPDGLQRDPSYIEHVKPGGTGPGADDHKLLYTYRTFKEVFEKTGFDVEILEYFDENGKFHSVGWNPADGMISRSRRFDARNKDGKLHYTSLIIDAHRS
jgi:predicted SAM-dependent methyltransferase